MSVSFYITDDNTQECLEALKDQTAAALEEIGLAAEGFAKRLCPVDTGRLRNSITHATDKDSAYVGTNVEYAPYVELGTSRTRAQPYLRPAVENNVGTYKKILDRHLKS